MAGDESAMSEAARRGWALFQDNSKGRCSICHAGFNFTDERYHNLGVGTEAEGWEERHAGRYGVTKKAEDLGSFKTPTLRQLRDTGPYMHDGSQETLAEVLDYYVQGGHANPHLSPEIRPLVLTDAEKRDLLAFLDALNGDVTPVEVPEPLR